MKLHSRVRWGGWLTVILAIAACVGIAALLGFGFRATREWQRSSQLLLTREIEAGADLLVTALLRDMAGVQSRVLANRDWAESSISIPATSTQVAIAFARYPYPESFFIWQSGNPQIIFFNRAERYPPWRSRDTHMHGYPVVIEANPPGASVLRQRIDAFGKSRFRYVALERELANQPYQVVARLMYADDLQAELHSVIGFTVNLTWVRESYFADIFSQVTPIAGRGVGLEVGVLDERGSRIWGEQDNQMSAVREFPLLFLDPTLGKVALDQLSGLRTWKISASPSEQSVLRYPSEEADEALIIAAVAALVLCLGLILSLRAVQEGAELAEMRSEFVSSVTHDLKMPLANIRAMADTLMLRSIDAEKVRKYGGHLRQEAKRLTRLVDNLLAYARVTDVANVYTFEPVVPARLVNDALLSFQQPLSEQAFTVELDVPDNLPLVKADRASMVLALDNLIDNAIRYSTDNRFIRITAKQSDHVVAFEVQDRGIGIPSEELQSVSRKFVRGRSAKPGGSGLGLAIVTRIVTDHRGIFTIKSTDGAGTVALIALPVSQE